MEKKELAQIYSTEFSNLAIYLTRFCCFIVEVVWSLFSFYLLDFNSFLILWMTFVSRTFFSPSL